MSAAFGMFGKIATFAALEQAYFWMIKGGTAVSPLLFDGNFVTLQHHSAGRNGRNGRKIANISTMKMVFLK